jgi:hypothetical protein
MTLGQQELAVPRMRYQPAIRVHQPLLQTGQRYLLDLNR